jgi:hypothetical protein
VPADEGIDWGDDEPDDLDGAPVDNEPARVNPAAQ